MVIPHDQLALAVDSRRDRLTRANWLHFAAYAGLAPHQTERLLTAQVDALARCVALIGRSELPAEMQAEYKRLLRARSSVLMP